MSKFWVIFKKEYAQVVKKKSFIIGIILTPALMIGFTVLPAMLTRIKSSSAEQMAIIDQSKLHVGQRFAEEIAEYKLEETEDSYYEVRRIFEIDPIESERFEQLNDSLRNEIIEKDIKYYFVIKSEPLVNDTNIYMVTNSDNFTTIKRFERKISKVLSTMRLTNADINLGVDSVLNITRRIDLKIKDAKGEVIPFQIKYFAAIAMVGIIFGMIVGYGQMVMRSVIEEKNSRIMEVMMSSVSAFQLMLGKVLGLGAATLTQVAIWFAIGAIISTQKTALDISPAIERILFNGPIIIFFILFLVSGYIMFSTFFALIGSIVTNEKEAQSFVMPITMSMILPFLVGIYVIQEPHSIFAVTISMIPIFAPTMMMMRLVFIAPTLSEYSMFSGIVGEATLSLLIVVSFTIFMIWLTSKIFRIGILMYGKRPTLPEIMKWIKS